MFRQSATRPRLLAQGYTCAFVMCTLLILVATEDISELPKTVRRFGIYSLIRCAKLCQSETSPPCGCFTFDQEKAACLMRPHCSGGEKERGVISTEKTVQQAFKKAIIPKEYLGDIHENKKNVHDEKAILKTQMRHTRDTKGDHASLAMTSKERRGLRLRRRRDPPMTSNSTGRTNVQSADAEAFRRVLHRAVEKEFERKDRENLILDTLEKLYNDIKKVTRRGYSPRREQQLEKLEKKKQKLTSALKEAKRRFEASHKKVKDLRQKLQQSTNKAGKPESETLERNTTSPFPTSTTTSLPTSPETPIPKNVSESPSIPKNVSESQSTEVQNLEAALKEARDESSAKRERKQSILKQLRAVKENITRAMQGPVDHRMVQRLAGLEEEKQKLRHQLVIAREEFRDSRRRSAELEREFKEAKGEAKALESSGEMRTMALKHSPKETALGVALQKAGQAEPYKKDEKGDSNQKPSDNIKHQDFSPEEKSHLSHPTGGESGKAKNRVADTELETEQPNNRDGDKTKATEQNATQSPHAKPISGTDSAGIRHSASSYALGVPMAKFAEPDAQSTSRHKKSTKLKPSAKKNRFSSRHSISTTTWLKHLYERAVHQAVTEMDKSHLSYLRSKKEKQLAKKASRMGNLLTSAKHKLKADHMERNIAFHGAKSNSAIEKARSLQEILNNLDKKRHVHRHRRYVTRHSLGGTNHSLTAYSKVTFGFTLPRTSRTSSSWAKKQSTHEQGYPFNHEDTEGVEVEKSPEFMRRKNKESETLAPSSLQTPTNGMAARHLHRSKRSLDELTVSSQSAFNSKTADAAKTPFLRTRQIRRAPGRANKKARKNDEKSETNALTKRTFVQLFRDVAKLMEQRALSASKIRRIMTKQASAKKSPVNLQRVHLSELMERLCKQQKEEATLRISIGIILGILVQGENYHSIQELIRKAKKATETTAKAAILATKISKTAESYSDGTSDLVKLETQAAESREGASMPEETELDSNRTSIAEARSVLLGLGLQLAAEEVKIWEGISRVLEKRAEERERKSKEAAIAERLKQKAKKQALLAQAVAKKKQAQAQAASVKLGKLTSKESSRNSKQNRSKTKEVAERVRLIDLAAADAAKKANSSRQRAALAEFIAGLFADGPASVRLYELLAKQVQFVQQRADGAALEFDLQSKEAKLDVEEAKIAESKVDDSLSGSTNHMASLATAKAYVSTRMVALARNISRLEMAIFRRLSKAMQQDLRARQAPEMLEKAAEEAHTEAMKAKVAERRIHMVEDQLGSRSTKDVMAEAAIANRSLQQAKERAREAKKAYVMTKHLARTAENLAEGGPVGRPRLLSQVDPANSTLDKQEVLRAAALQAEEQAVAEQEVADMLQQEARQLQVQAKQDDTAEAWAAAEQARRAAEQAERRARLVIQEAQFAQDLARSVPARGAVHLLPQVKSRSGKRKMVHEAIKSAKQQARDWGDRQEQLRAAKAANSSNVTNATQTESDVNPNPPPDHVLESSRSKKHRKPLATLVSAPPPLAGGKGRPQQSGAAAARDPAALEALARAQEKVEGASSEARARQETAEEALRRLEEQEERFNQLSLLTRSQHVGELEKLREEADEAAAKARVSKLQLVAAQAAADAAKEVLQELGDDIDVS